MTIVFEGVNRCGKTYLAEILSDKMSIPIFKIYDPKKNTGLSEISKEIESSGIQTVTNFYEDLITIQLLSQIEYKGILLDRSLPSEYCYGALQNRLPMPENIIVWWFNKLKSMGGYYVWVYCDWPTVQHRKIRKGWLENYNDWNILNNKYTEMYEMATKLDVKRICIDNSLGKENTAKSQMMEILRDFEIERKQI